MVLPMRTVLVALCMLWATACATQPALPPPGIPDAGLAERVAVPYDPAYPRVVVVVEPVQLGGEQRRDDAPTRSGWGPWGWSLPHTATDDPNCCNLPDAPGVGIARALTIDLERAVASIGNVRLVEYEQYVATADQRSLLPPGYVGPFVIGGAVQEFNEHIASRAVGGGSVLGTIGAALSIAGAVVGDPALTWGGLGLAAVSPALDFRVTQRTGSVQLDLRIFDPRAGLIVSSLTSHGTSTDRSTLNGFTLFGFGQPAPAYSLSLLGRAHRNAFNAVTTDIWEQLKPLL